MNDRDEIRRRRGGKRVYGTWAGDPNGYLEDVARCIVGVWSRGRGAIERQCRFPRGQGPGGLYCGIHDPAEVNRRKVLSEKKYREQVENSPHVRAARNHRAAVRLRKALVDVLRYVRNVELHRPRPVVEEKVMKRALKVVADTAEDYS